MTKKQSLGFGLTGFGITIVGLIITLSSSGEILVYIAGPFLLILFGLMRIFFISKNIIALKFTTIVYLSSIWVIFIYIDEYTSMFELLLDSSLFYVINIGLFISLLILILLYIPAIIVFLKIKSLPEKL